MGLIREIQGVNATINKQERARRERERLKILQENYNKEITEALFAEFMRIYNHYDMETAEEITILKKDNIIENLYSQIYNRHYLENRGRVELVFLPSPTWDTKYKFEQKKEKVFIYRDFDIVTDLQENYFKILQKAKKEFCNVQKIENKRLLLELKKRISQAMKLNDSKYFLALSLQKHENIMAIVDDITTNEQQKAFLLENYDKLLKQELKLYRGNIEADKKELKAEREAQKSKKQKSLISSLITSYILTDISKSLPKSFDKKKKY